MSVGYVVLASFSRLKVIIAVVNIANANIVENTVQKRSVHIRFEWDIGSY